MFTISNGLILKGQDLKPVRENIVVDDGKIIEIAKDAKEGKIIDVDGAVVSPSFINGHVHIGDSIIKDEGYGLSLSEMVKPPNGVKHVALSNAGDDELIDAMRKSMKDMVESGTTHFIDYREGGLKGVKLLKKASADLILTACPSCTMGLRFGQLISLNFKKTLEIRDFIETELEII